MDLSSFSSVEIFCIDLCLDILNQTNKNKENIKKMKKEDIPKLAKKVEKILPMMQSEIWKKLNIERRDCSRLISILVKQKLVKRTKVGGTYMVEKLDGNKSEVKNNFSALISGGAISPCIGCGMDCEPGICLLLHKWVVCK